ncbi:hypothetical protein JOD69_004442 [Methylocaldum sp. RMAD-M]|jgi:hypothetical protein|nr:hypothetical protein [Methylocaldum sp. RMAD-M]
MPTCLLSVTIFRSEPAVVWHVADGRNLPACRIHRAPCCYTGFRSSGRASGCPIAAIRAFSYLLYGHSRVGRESFPIANGVFGKGVAGAPGQAVCDWSAEAALPDTTSRPSVFVGRVATKATVCDWERIAELRMLESIHPSRRRQRLSPSRFCRTSEMKTLYHPLKPRGV